MKIVLLVVVCVNIVMLLLITAVAVIPGGLQLDSTFGNPMTIHNSPILTSNQSNKDTSTINPISIAKYHTCRIEHICEQTKGFSDSLELL